MNYECVQECVNTSQNLECVPVNQSPQANVCANLELC